MSPVYIFADGDEEIDRKQRELEELIRMQQVELAKIQKDREAQDDRVSSITYFPFNPLECLKQAHTNTKSLFCRNDKSANCSSSAKLSRESASDRWMTSDVTIARKNSDGSTRRRRSPRREVPPHDLFSSKSNQNFPS